MAKSPRAKQVAAVKAAASPAPAEQADPAPAEQADPAPAEQAEPAPAEQAGVEPGASGADHGDKINLIRVPVYVVRSTTPRSRRRAGIQFGPEPVEVDADALGNELFQQILDDPFLRVEVQ